MFEPRFFGNNKPPWGPLKRFFGEIVAETSVCILDFRPEPIWSKWSLTKNNFLSDFWIEKSDFFIHFESYFAAIMPLCITVHGQKRWLLSFSGSFYWRFYSFWIVAPKNQKRTSLTPTFHHIYVQTDLFKSLAYAITKNDRLISVGENKVQLEDIYTRSDASICKIDKMNPKILLVFIKWKKSKTSGLFDKKFFFTKNVEKSHEKITREPLKSVFNSVPFSVRFCGHC